MSRGPHTFTVNELKRAARGLQAVGVKIERVILEKGKIEFVTSAGKPTAKRAPVVPPPQSEAVA